MSSFEWIWGDTLFATLFGVPVLMQDLAECVAAVKADPKCAKDGTAPLYGMAAAMPDRSIISHFLVAYQDAILSL
jgi:sphinganine-1-phosphate aldolase